MTRGRPPGPLTSCQRSSNVHPTVTECPNPRQAERYAARPNRHTSPRERTGPVRIELPIWTVNIRIAGANFCPWCPTSRRYGRAQGGHKPAMLAQFVPAPPGTETLTL